MRRPQRRYQLPPLVSHPLDDLWSVVVPIARTNLVTNPSFETNATSWTAHLGASIAISTTRQRRGARSLQINPTAGFVNADGAFYGPITLAVSTTYAYSLDFWGQAGVKYQLYVATIGGVALATKQFTATGYWQRLSLIYTEATGAARRLYVTKVSSNRADAFFVDGVQIEACESGNYFATTYIDGDQTGLVPNQNPPAYVWSGVPHASSSSRSGQTRAGGRVRAFKDFGWTPTAIIGLGLAPPQNQMTEYAALDGGQDQGTRKPARQFTLAGRFSTRSYGQLRDYRGGLAAFLDRDLIGEDQRLKLFYQAEAEQAELIAKYAGGLEGNTDGHFGSEAPISFVQATPAILAGGDAGATLTAFAGATDADLIVYRSPGGAWAGLGSGITGTEVSAICYAPELGGVIVGGLFTDAGGSGADNIALWDGTAWSALGSATAITGIVRAIVRAPDGSIYVGGDFLNAGGVAAADRIARWDGSAWTAVGPSGANGAVYALAMAPDGTLYAGGVFTDIGGSGVDFAASWDGSAWAEIGPIPTFNNNVFALLVDPAGNLYVGGLFTNAGGVAAADFIAKWNGTAWSGLSTGMDGYVQALAMGPNGILYAGGAFATAGGIAIGDLAQWNGVAWSALGSGVNGDVYSLAIALDGTLYAGGGFTTAGGITVPDGFARWNGATWVFPGIDLPGSPIVGALKAMPDGGLYVGYGTSGTANAQALTTVTNPGTARSYLTIIYEAETNPATIYLVGNATIGRYIYFNLTIQPGERIVMRFEPDNLSFVSNFQGNVAHTILPGSDQADFFVQPGGNVLVNHASDVNGNALAQWRPVYASLDDVP